MTIHTNGCMPGLLAIGKTAQTLPVSIVFLQHNNHEHTSQTMHAPLICAFINTNGIPVLLEKLEELGNNRKLTQYMRDATEDDQSRSFRVKSRITKVSGITSNMNGIEMMRTSSVAAAIGSGRRPHAWVPQSSGRILMLFTPLSRISVHTSFFTTY